MHLAGASRMKRICGLLVGIAALNILSACSEREAPTDTARVMLPEHGRGRCQVGYRDMHRNVLCAEVGHVMRSEIRISTNARIVVAPDRSSRFDEVGSLLRSLTDAGYILIEFDKQ